VNHRDAPDPTERLIDAYAASLYRIGLHLTGSEKDAEEVALAALRAGALRRHAFEAESAFRSWLCGIAAGAANERARERQPACRIILRRPAHLRVMLVRRFRPERPHRIGRGTPGGAR
jgi:DNA-directed RNA polymerase specialized sigma24 family protein